MATEAYDGSEPVNLGAGFEITIPDLTLLIARLTRFTGEIRWDTTKPDGQPRRSLDTTRAERLFGFRAESVRGRAEEDDRVVPECRERAEVRWRVLRLKRWWRLGAVESLCGCAVAADLLSARASSSQSLGLTPAGSFG